MRMNMENLSEELSDVRRDADDNMDLSAVDLKILDELANGRATQGFLVDVTDEPRHRIHQRLQLLAAAGHIEKIHESTALYELVDDPRDDGEGSDDG